MHVHRILELNNYSLCPPNKSSIAICNSSYIHVDFHILGEVIFPTLFTWNVVHIDTSHCFLFIETIFTKINFNLHNVLWRGNYNARDKELCSVNMDMR
jgi:hypothetical protein